MFATLNLALMAVFSGEAEGGLLSINPGLIVWTFVIFICLLIILRLVAWKPILSALNEREKFIENSLKKAEAASADAEKLVADNKESLAKAEEEAQKVIAQGREYAENLKTQIIEDSKTEAKKIIDNATAEIDRKQAEAFNSLKAQVAEIAINAAEKIVKESLDSAKQKEMVNKYIDDISKN